MYKIIDLDIDEFLSGDTRLDAIALVEHPAIELPFLYFNEDKCKCDVGQVCDDEVPLVDEMMELEDLLRSGWEIEDIKDVDAEQINKEYQATFNKTSGDKYENFYRIASRPNLPSVLDRFNKRRRFIYAVAPGYGPDIIETSRDFCRRMFGKRQLVYRYEDIQMLSTVINAEDGNRRIIPRPKGASVNLFIYQGGANCRHIWKEIHLADVGRIKNEVRETVTNETPQLNAPGRAGQPNPPVEYGRTRNAEVVEQESENSQEGFNESRPLPIGYIKGLPVLSTQEQALEYAKDYGCNECQEIEYLDGVGYIPCGLTDDYIQSFSFKLDEEKRMLYSPAMIPDKLIVRYEDGEKYFVRFTKDSIERAAHKFLMEKRVDKTNLEHNNSQSFDDIYLVESWIVKGSQDKVYELGYAKEEVPEGSWIVGYKVLNDDVWENKIKKGKVKGLSVQGLFDMKENFNAQTDNDYLIIDNIINILKNVK